MNIINFVTAFGFLFLIANDSQDFQDVIDADKRLNLLIVQHNVNAAKDVYGDDFILTTSSGKTKTKQDMLAEIGLPDLQFDINETTDIAVRILDNTAVLTGTLHQKGLYKQKPFDHTFLVTDTWVLVKGNWKLLAGHATPIKQP